MGNRKPSESTDSIATYWQERPVKYVFQGGELMVEEVKAPWDLFSESRWLGSPIGTEFHQALVRNGLERIFSIRNKEGYPYCDIITQLKGTPPVNIDWAPHRGLKTSSYMTIDNQKLIVLDVVAKEGKRAEEPLLRLARDFFVSQGGTLHNEHPNCLVFSDKKIISEWRSVIDKKIKTDLVISSFPIKEKEARDLLNPHASYAPNLELALLLLEGRYWHRCLINGDEEWTGEVLSHMEGDSDDQPDIINVLGQSDHAHIIFARVKAMFARESKKK